MSLMQVGPNAWAIPAHLAERVEIIREKDWPDGRPAIRCPAGPVCEWMKDMDVQVLVATTGGGSYESNDGMSSRDSESRQIWRKANRYWNRRAPSDGYREAFVWAETMPTLPNWHSPVCPGTEIRGDGDGYRAGNSFRPTKIHEIVTDLPRVAWEEYLKPTGSFIGLGLVTDDQIENKFLSAAIFYGWDIYDG